MRERVLTVRERIIVHLFSFGRFAEEFECPEEMCQSGISGALGKSRAHVTLELNRMKEAGLVHERNAHITGGRSKRKTYLLTPAGIDLYNQINEFLETLDIRVAGTGGSKAMSGADAAELLRKDFGQSRIAAVDMILASGEVLDLSVFSEGGNQKSHLPPGNDDYLPRKEYDRMMQLVRADRPNTVMLLGIPGIGKTTLLSELAGNLESDVLYHRLYPFDSQISVIRDMAEFFAERGFPELGRYMASRSPFDLTEAGTHLARYLKTGKYVLMFDEFEQAPGVLMPVFSMLMERVCGSGSCVLVASSKKGDFYHMRDSALEGKVSEFTLGAMDRDNSLKLLGGKGKAEYLKLAGGHPLTLKLLAAGMKANDLAGFVECEILGSDCELSRLCRFAAVLRKPFNPEDLELAGFDNARTIRNNLSFEPQPCGGYMLHPAISSMILGSTGKRMLRELHSVAADHYVRAGDEHLEALHHLLGAERKDDARSYILDKGEALLETENPEEMAVIMELALWGGCDDVELMYLAARVLDSAGKWDMAKELAVKIEKCSGGLPETVGARILHANILAKKGKAKEALAVLDAVPELGKEMELKARVEYARASAMRRMGRNSEALKSCERAAKAGKKAGNAILTARCIMESAMVMNAMGEHEKALRKLDEAIKHFWGQDTISDRIRCGINRGMVLRSLERWDEAIETLEEAAKMAADAGLNRFRAHALANLTELLNREGDFGRSVQLAGEAREMFSLLGEPVMEIASMLNLAAAHAGAGDGERALAVIEEALKLMGKHNLMKERRAWLVECADILRSLGEDKRASEILKL